MSNVLSTETSAEISAELAKATASIEHNCAAWITRWADEQPQALAWADDHRRCDYASAEDRIQRLATWLAAHGVCAGSRVALWLGNRGAMLEAVFASARLAAIALPINARLTAAEVSFQLDDATPCVLLVEREWRDRAEDAGRLMNTPRPRLLEVGSIERRAGPDKASDAYEEALASQVPASVIHPVRPDDPMILMYTSGTTGKPKGALLPHRKTLYNSLNAEDFFGIQASDRVLVVAPLFHSLGLQILALPAIFKGAGLVLQQGFSAARAWATIEAESITYYGGVPTMHQRMLEALDGQGPVASPPRSLRFAFTAGAAAAPEMIRAFHSLGLVLKQGYGQTETSTLTCLEADRALAKAGSVGRPVRYVDLRLIDPMTIEGAVADWGDVAAGVVGEIVARGPITMLGYWQRPEATAETLREDWVRTGDLATRDEDFDITLVGRSREMYISGGENVYPAEVEATLVCHPDIEEAAVVAIPDREWGEVGRAHIVLVEDKTTAPAHLLEWMTTQLARYKQPREIIIETELPRTASGKVQKHRLAKTAPKGNDSA
jgi:fatty-acyl-CoA synthase